MTDNLIRRLVFAIWKKKKKKKDIFMIWLSFYQFWVNFSHILKCSVVEEWHWPEFMAGNGNDSGTAKKKKKKKKMPSLLPDYAFINCGLISPIFGHCFLNAQCWHSGICRNQWQENGNESGTAKKMHLCDLIILLSIFESISPIFMFFCQILKCSMLTKWHQPEYMVRNGKEPGTVKRCIVAICLCFYQF